MLHASKYCVAYTGAGISTSAGIKDYATKAQDERRMSLGDIRPSEAQPSEAHRVLVAMYQAGQLKHWVQQNHDGLPQKAGLPQEAINELHGAWFDPSNPVVHFRAQIRPDLFDWFLDTELRCDLCIAAGTSLCDTPSTADRLVVSPALRAAEVPSRALGSVVVGIQRTRLDSRVQLRVFALIDDFFRRVGERLWGSPWPERAPSVSIPTPFGRRRASAPAVLCDEDQEQEKKAIPKWKQQSQALRAAIRARRGWDPSLSEDTKLHEVACNYADAGNTFTYDRLGERCSIHQKEDARESVSTVLTEILSPGRHVYITAGPKQGVICKVLGTDPSGSTNLAGGVRLGCWWERAALMGSIHRFPVALGPVPRPHQWENVMDAVEAVTAETAVPATSLDGMWVGHAVLIDKEGERSKHPTARPDRAQALRWILGSCGNGKVFGAGYTTWPAAHVMNSNFGRVWKTLEGKYSPDEKGKVQLTATWERVPGSRIESDGLGKAQGAAVHTHLQFNGHVYIKSGELCIAGKWYDETPEGTIVCGALALTKVIDERMQVGMWRGTVSGQTERWVLGIQQGLQAPTVFGATLTPHGPKLLRGVTSEGSIEVHEHEVYKGSARLVCKGSVSNGILTGSCRRGEQTGKFNLKLSTIAASGKVTGSWRRWSWLGAVAEDCFSSLLSRAFACWANPYRLHNLRR
eukprot:gnl/MRDRNA2_/MRDRNA2_27941_c0_seq1.p1 gnl/MRDRNA2_/MRDRNA2_27941_c0~~gnl/MRDRNA2_/MRDRNA2_27941_c0_seq1.p1  ORF type:complete len:785 (+),score=152.94 gnl/MRDRNA2_/MRDRNA2_27941_c0_seq1:287-2356(+)